METFNVSPTTVPAVVPIAAVQPVDGSPSWGVPVLTATSWSSEPVAFSDVPMLTAVAATLPSIVVPTTDTPSTDVTPVSVPSTESVLNSFVSATGKAVEGVGQVAGAGIEKAKKVGNELWAGVNSPTSAHVTQVKSKYNKNPAPGNRDCGPVSVVVALKLLDKNIPGVSENAKPQTLVNRVRKLAGSPNNANSTTNLELEQALGKAGVNTQEVTDFSSIRKSVSEGKPVILNGNPRNEGAYGFKYKSEQMTPYNGAHWIVVSGLDQETGKFIINDPLSKIGPVKVTPSELEAYRGGSLGIEVSE